MKWFNLLQNINKFHPSFGVFQLKANALISMYFKIVRKTQISYHEHTVNNV